MNDVLVMVGAGPLDLLGLFIILGLGIRAGWQFCDFLNELVCAGLDRIHGWLLRRKARRMLAASEEPDEDASLRRSA